MAQADHTVLMGWGHSAACHVLAIGFNKCTHHTECGTILWQAWWACLSLGVGGSPTMHASPSLPLEKFCKELELPFLAWSTSSAKNCWPLLANSLLRMDYCSQKGRLQSFNVSTVKRLSRRAKHKWLTISLCWENGHVARFLPSPHTLVTEWTAINKLSARFLFTFPGDYLSLTSFTVCSIWDNLRGKQSLPSGLGRGGGHLVAF